MERGDCNRKGKHLTREERIVIERMSRGGRCHAPSRPALRRARTLGGQWWTPDLKPGAKLE